MGSCQTLCIVYAIENDLCVIAALDLCTITQCIVIRFVCCIQKETFPSILSLCIHSHFCEHFFVDASHHFCVFAILCFEPQSCFHLKKHSSCGDVLGFAVILLYYMLLYLQCIFHRINH